MRRILTLYTATRPVRPRHRGLPRAHVLRRVAIKIIEPDCTVITEGVPRAVPRGPLDHTHTQGEAIVLGGYRTIRVLEVCEDDGRGGTVARTDVGEKVVGLGADSAPEKERAQHKEMHGEPHCFILFFSLPKIIL